MDAKEELTIFDEIYDPLDGRFYARERGQWVTRDGERLQIRDMEDSHLTNSINMLTRKGLNGISAYNELVGEANRRKLKGIWDMSIPVPNMWQSPNKAWNEQPEFESIKKKEPIKNGAKNKMISKELTFEADKSFLVSVNTYMKQLSYELAMLTEFPEEFRAYNSGHYDKENFENAITNCKEILSLAKTHKIVSRNEDLKIKVKINREGFGSSRTVEVPMVWSTVLPAPKKISLDVSDFSLDLRGKVGTEVPLPTKEALEQLRNTKGQFINYELWWVPSKFDVEVVQVPKDDDPILVGVRRYRGEPVYFELHRWIDEMREDAYWSKEGY